MEIYNTKIEKKEFDTIYDKFQNENIYIINPAIWIAQNMNGHDAMQQCFKFIDISACIVFTTLEDGIIGKGVYEEINYALENKKKIPLGIIEISVTPADKCHTLSTKASIYEDEISADYILKKHKQKPVGGINLAHI